MLQPFKVIARFTNKRHIDGHVLEINAAGMTIQLDSPAPSASHLWLRFGLPGGHGDCLALGEILEAEKQNLRIRFKHLFPKDRRTLNRFVGITDADTIAA